MSMDGIRFNSSNQANEQQNIVPCIAVLHRRDDPGGDIGGDQSGDSCTGMDVQVVKAGIPKGDLEGQKKTRLLSTPFFFKSPQRFRYRKSKRPVDRINGLRQKKKDAKNANYAVRTRASFRIVAFRRNFFLKATALPLGQVSSRKLQKL